ncbi:MAG: hypothetical protein A3I66_09710 [Burkholderiales bacterium RIFCSPLOWO2_02_FULL_57_36]|nr:MAG: hypothetical protein A3I66_09710 [Burkholderiales bacterium RIFCSPLOWO2_02_FULL_57_36]
MTRAPHLLFVSADPGLLNHWQRALDRCVTTTYSRLIDVPPPASSGDMVVWLDLSVPDIAAWTHPIWAKLLKTQQMKVVAASSNPNDNEAIQALDAGCAAYCHAFADAATLLQVKEVVQAGHVWIGPTLMQRLIHSAHRAAASSMPPQLDWGNGLTQREREVAVLAANGASNQDISRDCSISERTVKAHLSAVFDKLNLTDRLQLALRVHGIH